MSSGAPSVDFFEGRGGLVGPWFCFSGDFLFLDIFGLTKVPWEYFFIFSRLLKQIQGTGGFYMFFFFPKKGEG